MNKEMNEKALELLVMVQQLAEYYQIERMLESDCSLFIGVADEGWRVTVSDNQRAILVEMGLMNVRRYIKEAVAEIKEKCGGW